MLKYKISCFLFVPLPPLYMSGRENEQETTETTNTKTLLTL